MNSLHLNKNTMAEFKEKIPKPILVRGTHINESFYEPTLNETNLFQKIILKYKKKAIQIEEIIQRQKREKEREEKEIKLKEFICFEKLIDYFEEKEKEKLSNKICKKLQEDLDILPQIEKPETINIELFEELIKLECWIEEHKRITLEHIKICEYCQSMP